MEYLDGNMEAEAVGRCWSCQLIVNTANCVVIDAETVSVCKGCWNDLSVSARILIAHKLRSGVGIADALEAFQKLVQSDQSDYWQRLIGSG